MTSPVQLSDLPVASIANDGDLMLLRSGLTDFQIIVSKVRQINIAGLPTLPAQPQATDVMMLQQNGTTGQVLFSQVGFVSNTRMWFYQASPPAGWSLLSGVSDCLLSVQSSGSDPQNEYPTAGIEAGSWQQLDVGGVSGQGLTKDQMPLHSHTVTMRTSSGLANPFSAGLGGNSTNYLTGSEGSSSGTDGTSQAHSHGNNWRPLAAVGIICFKN